MEYALEGYGFSVAGLMRAEVKRRVGPDPRIDLHLDPILSMMDREAEFEPNPTALSRRLSLFMMRMALRRRELPLELVEMGRFDLAPPPDLLAALDGLWPAGPLGGRALRVATATKAAFDGLREKRLMLHLTNCSIEQDEQAAEHLVLGVYSPSLTETIRVDDTVAAGVMVALHGDPGGAYRLEVLPRIYRKVCQNGMVIYRGKARSHEVEPEVLEDQWAPDRLVAAIKRQITACLDEPAFAVEAASCQRSASEPLDPTGDSFAVLLNDRLQPTLAHAVHQRYLLQADFTRWGLVNAITAEARTLPHAAALHLERLGGRLARTELSVERWSAPGGWELLEHEKPRRE